MLFNILFARLASIRSRRSAGSKGFRYRIPIIVRRRPFCRKAHGGLWAGIRVDEARGSGRDGSTPSWRCVTTNKGRDGIHVQARPSVCKSAIPKYAAHCSSKCRITKKQLAACKTRHFLRPVFPICYGPHLRSLGEDAHEKRWYCRSVDDAVY